MKRIQLKKILPWIVSIIIFYYLFKKYPISQLVRASSHLNVLLFIGYSTLYFFWIWIVDCWSLSRLLTWFGFPTRTLDLSTVRFASYLVAVVNYGVAQGLLAYFFKKTKSVPLYKSASIIFFTLIIDLYWVISFAFIGSFFLDFSASGTSLSRIIQMFWGAATIGLASFIIFFSLPINRKALNWVRSRELFHTFHNAKAHHYLKLMMMRLPMHLAINTSLYFVAIFFDVHIPFLTVLAFQPIVILVAIIPITPGGLGTVQVAIVELFKNHVHGDIISQGVVTSSELLLSMSLLAVFANYFLKALTGAFFLKKSLGYRST